MKQLLIVLPLLLLAGCGSDSDSEPPVNDVAIQDDGPSIGTLSGRIVEAVNGAPLADVALTLLRVDGEAPDALATGTSDVDGLYRFETLPIGGRYRVDLAVEGYRDESYSDVVFAAASDDPTLTLEPARLVPDDNAGTGSLSGVVTSAVDGTGLGGLRLEFRRGINTRSGEVVATATTAADGSYAVSDLEYGNLTCVITGEGFATAYATVIAFGGVERGDQNAAISPRVDIGDTRIVLSWGESPRDLDAHLTGPGAGGEAPFHVYFSDKTADVAVLDLDDTTSFGPETITVDASRDGVFRYSVDNFSGGGADVLSASGARVQVIREEGTVAEFFVPRGEGDLWTVFDLIGGEILPVNTITFRESDDDHFAPDTLR